MSLPNYGHTPAKVAAVAGVSPVTAKKWLVRSPTGMYACMDAGVFPDQKQHSGR